MTASFWTTFKITQYTWDHTANKNFRFF